MLVVSHGLKILQEKKIFNVKEHPTQIESQGQKPI